MQLIVFYISFFWLQIFNLEFIAAPDQLSTRVENPILKHQVNLIVGDRVVFDEIMMENATLSRYPNQLMFTIMDDEGQHITLTFAGKGIESRKPESLSFNEPGLWHGFTESGDVFFIDFGKFHPEREPGQIKYDMSFPKNIMKGELTILSWTSSEFVFEFSGKLGNEDEVESPELWVPFSGRVQGDQYQEF